MNSSPVLTVVHDFLPKRPSTRAAQVMDHFGIGFEQEPHVIARDFPLPVQQGEIVLFTGESGSGKSSLMRALAAQRVEFGESVLHLDDLQLEPRILVDHLPVEIEESLPLLAACGLGEAQLLLRTPQELSDGQRYRFRLALALSHQPDWIVADEFTATLDRRLAKVIASNISKLAARTGTGFLLATTHEDLLEDLSPNRHVQCRLDGELRVTPREGSPDAASSKKKSHLQTTCGCPPRPSPTGRISLGGIIGRTSLG